MDGVKTKASFVEMGHSLHFFTADCQHELKLPVPKFVSSFDGGTSLVDAVAPML